MSETTEEPIPSGPSGSKVLRTTKETHPHLPPGLILDHEGKVCKVCNSFSDWAKIKKKKTAASTPGTSSSATGMAGFAGLMGASSKVSAKATQADAERESTAYSSSSPQSLDRNDCPADTVLLGRSTWTFLHTTAAYYPVAAPPETQRSMRSLLSSLSMLYPCVPCAEDFQVKVDEHPPDVTGREALSKWLCRRHNEVNEKLGKKPFQCDWSSLNRRWKEGPEDGSCD